MTVRTRFAPSPTGSLHVGGARTALYCLLHARKTGGRFVLRIEDTDRARSTEEAAQGILRDMRWLGLDWDEGPENGGPAAPYFQSQRLDIYAEYTQQLLDAGHAYEAWESREELGKLREAAGGYGFRYRQQTYTDADLARFREEGRTPVVRLKAPEHDVTIVDTILGEVTVAASDLDDIVIRKADGFPTYHFAVVVDDHHMQITQVLRGQEHLMNTHKHWGLATALGWELPAPGHLPIINNPTGGKMSKRSKAAAARAAARGAAKEGGHSGWQWLADATDLDATELQRFMKKKHDGVAMAETIAKHLHADLPMIEVLDFRRGGYLPEALLNYLALLGWSPGDDREIMSLEEMAEAFTLERVNKTAARFDPEKLRWMNGEYMKTLPTERLLALWRQYAEVVPDGTFASASDAERSALLAMYRERAQTLAEIDAQAAFFRVAPTEYNAKAVKKWMKAAGIEMLGNARNVLAEVDWERDALEAALTELAEGKLGKVAQPLRVALTGNSVSPSLFDTLAFFERDEVLRRIDACLTELGD